MFKLWCEQGISLTLVPRPSTLDKKIDSKLACPFVHPTEVFTQFQLAATCDYFRVRLARAFCNGRKLKTWVYLRLRLARPCVYLR